jgi:hypothetical protein
VAKQVDQVVVQRLVQAKLEEQRQRCIAAKLALLKLCSTLNQLTSDQQQLSVLALVKAATDFDQTQPISDHILLHLRHGGDKDDSHLLIFENDQTKLLGYAHLDQTDQVAGPSVELVVDPNTAKRELAKHFYQKLLKYVVIDYVFGHMVIYQLLASLQFK